MAIILSFVFKIDSPISTITLRDEMVYSLVQDKVDNNIVSTSLECQQRTSLIQMRPPTSLILYNPTCRRFQSMRFKPP